MIFNTNPYMTQAQVGGTKAFVGRADVLRNVLQDFKDSRKNAMVLYGQKRVGKTSVLKELLASLPREGSYAPVYFDLRDKATLSLKRILWDLSKQILHSLDIPPLDHLSGDFSIGFQKVFLPHVLAQFPEETALVLLFDEFDVPDGESSPPPFFSYLLDLISLDRERIKFVFVIGDRPESLPDIHVFLFKYLKFKHIKMLSPKETIAVVHLSKQNASLKWPADLLSEIQTLTGGHPYLTQQVCQMIWERLYDSDPEDVPVVRQDDIDASIMDMIEIVDDPLKQLWGGLDMAEQVVVSLMAEAGSGHIVFKEFRNRLKENSYDMFVKNLEKIFSSLEKWEVIQSENDGYRIRAEIMRRWILQRKPLDEGRISQILATAETLFEAAYALYQEDEFEQAIPVLQQLIRLYPDHLKANQLLTEIFLARGNTGEALKLLEFLYKRNPWGTRPRLIQTLLVEAQKRGQEDERLVLYERVLALDPGQSEALAEYKQIYEKQGDAAYQKGQFEKAWEVYRKIGAREKVEKANQKIQLENLYQDALEALEKNEGKKAQKLLAEVLSIEPTFRDATRYMHLAVSGTDTLELDALIAELEEEVASEDLIIPSESEDAVSERPDPSLPVSSSKTIWESFKSIPRRFFGFRRKPVNGLGQVGPYKLVSKIARGGMSELFIALNEKGNFRRTVIIKRVLPHLAEKPHLISMFNQEARLAALLYHPNIVQIIDFYDEENAIIMEYIRGKNLAEIAHAATEVFSFDQSVFVASQICKGLEHAHSKRNDQTGEPLHIVHRDIKPSNILISFNGEVKITDFGISKANTESGSGATTVAGEIKGTLTYMAPEQVEIGAEAVDNRTDIYSFGIVFYEMLSGKKLRKFISKVGVAKVFNQIVENKIDPISRLRPDIPPDLSKIVMKCLEKDKASRYQHAREISADLKRLKRRLNITFDASSLADFMKKYFKDEEDEENISPPTSPE